MAGGLVEPYVGPDDGEVVEGEGIQGGEETGDLSRAGVLTAGRGVRHRATRGPGVRVKSVWAGLGATGQSKAPGSGPYPNGTAHAGWSRLDGELARERWTPGGPVPLSGAADPTRGRVGDPSKPLQKGGDASIGLLLG